MPDNRPIGVFDSGAGGLTILAELRQQLPQEAYLYFGDSGHCPYGVRSQEQIRRLSEAATQFLVARNAKLVVVACNTASTAALAFLRERFSVPFIGVVPAIKPAAAQSARRCIGVIATSSAAEGDYLHQLIAQYADGVRVLIQPAPQLVKVVEAGQFAGPHIDALLHYYLDPLLAAGIDKLVLGCTHYPGLRPAIERICGPTVAVIDSGAAIARRTRQVLESGDQLGARDFPAPCHFWCSGSPEQFAPIVAALLQLPLPVVEYANPACHVPV